MTRALLCNAGCRWGSGFVGQRKGLVRQLCEGVTPTAAAMMIFRSSFPRSAGVSLGDGGRTKRVRLGAMRGVWDWGCAWRVDTGWTLGGARRRLRTWCVGADHYVLRANLPIGSPRSRPLGALFAISPPCPPSSPAHLQCTTTSFDFHRVYLVNT